MNRNSKEVNLLAELRWNPMLSDWVMVASHRQNRPNMPKDWCPFCPGSGKVPDSYDVHMYPNDFPALRTDPPEPDDVADGPYRTAATYGQCEVVLYSPQHTVTLPELPLAHVRKLVDLWLERYRLLASDEKVKYILIFENRGELVGVTMPHPHGQIYAYSYVPLKLRRELDSARSHYEVTGKCLVCEMNAEEARFEKRMVLENRSFVTYLPFYSEYPYGVIIASKAHHSSMLQFDDSELTDLADILRRTAGTLDALFDKPMPYMMVIHQAPVNTEPEADGYFHFHIEFYPPLRSADRVKFQASSETGAWAPCNPTAPEATAQELREAFARLRMEE